ncbi:RNA 2'-phosphotransferase [Psychrobacter sp. SIMBA_152]
MKKLPTITKDVIQAVVATSDKKRFTLSPDGTRIRAAQGHSIEVCRKGAAGCSLSRHRSE